VFSSPDDYYGPSIIPDLGCNDLSGSYDANGDWHYNTLCIYDKYYAEGCSNLDGEYNELGVWEYADPCSLDDDDEDDDVCEEGNSECINDSVNRVA